MQDKCCTFALAYAKVRDDSQLCLPKKLALRYAFLNGTNT